MRHAFASWDNFPVTTAFQTELFRKLPSVDDVVRTPQVTSLTASYGADSVVDAARRDGVLLCGSGAQRGGAVSGLGGHNAAQAVLELA